MSESGFVEVDGGRVFYVASGSGLPVVLIHGGFSDVGAFDAQVDGLSQVCTLVRVDLRGYGQSSPPGGDSYRHCDDVAAVLDALGFDRAVIGGCSFGGAVAVDFALAYPDRVAGLILESPTLFAGWWWREELPVKPMFEAARTGGIEALRRTVKEAELMASVMGRPESAAAFSDMVDRYAGWHFQNRDTAVWFEDDAVARLEEITPPTVVVCGAHDVLDHRLMGEELAQRLPNVSGHLWPDSGHLPNIEEPEAFNQLVIDFLSTIQPNSPA